MRAVTCHQGTLAVADVPMPAPGPGQVLLRVTRAGICGSDLHVRRYADASADVAAETGYDAFMRPADTVVLGHEFAGEVLAYGPGCRQEWPVGTPVTAPPLLGRGDGGHMIGFSALAPGAYAECVLVSEDLAIPVPDGLSPEHAALTEPLSVALHAVRRSGIGRRDVAVVVGCGPVGLAVILMLKARGVRTVVASDYSQSRREVARRCGADVVVDPATHSVWDAYDQPRSEVRTVTDRYGRGLEAMAKLRRVPRLPWWQVVRAADRAGAMRGPVVFECVGVPGVIEEIITGAPFLARVVVVGVCMEHDSFRPTMAINKEISLRFVFNFDSSEFRESLMMMAKGTLDPSPLVTRTVGLADVPATFDALSSSPEQVKVLIDPLALSAPPPEVEDAQTARLVSAASTVRSVRSGTGRGS